MAVVSNTAYGALYGYVLPNATAGNYTITANFSPATVKVGLLVTEYSNINISPGRHQRIGVERVLRQLCKNNQLHHGRRK